MAGNFDLWVKACEEFGQGIYKLTGNPERGHGVYETVREYFPPGSYNTAREVCYHLWWHGRQEHVSVDGRAIWAAWEGRDDK